MLKTMKNMLETGSDLAFVTVIASSGATPRGAGARMLVGKDGRICGTIGGGAVEYRSEQIAAEVLKERKSGQHDFSLTRDDVENLGMICGGAVNVFFRFIPAHDPGMLALAQEAERRFAKGEDLWLISEISDGGSFGLFSEDEGYFGIDAPAWVHDILTRHPLRRIWEGRDFYVEQINSSGRVFVFGCGHVAQELVPALSHVGFRCVAMDDRPEFADPALFPAGTDVRLIDFEKIADAVTIGAEDYVCVMTRGHAFDLIVQAQVLKTPACYIGVIGSAAKKAGVYAKLYEMGFTKEDTDRIVSPIGLEIKAETPAEIAVSIAGQLIELRAIRNEK
jgi:xanthine dehydrogenase accessory factor